LLVADLLRPPVDLHDSLAADALREVLVRSPDADLLHPPVRGGNPGGGGQGVVRLQLDHRPHHDPHCRQCLLERMELREEGGLDTLAGLVARPELVAEGLDDVIGRDADVRGALLDHLEDGIEDAEHATEWRVVALGEAT
jgi:hypothetical protein